METGLRDNKDYEEAKAVADNNPDFIKVHHDILKKGDSIYAFRNRRLEFLGVVGEKETVWKDSPYGTVYPDKRWHDTEGLEIDLCFQLYKKIN